MRTRLYRFLLGVWRYVPRRIRRMVVLAVSPTCTVGAICVIERPDGAVLLVKHVYREHWGIPGGLLKRGEEPAAGAVREVREEIGLDIELVGEPSVVVDPSVRRVDVIFRARPRELAQVGSVKPRSAEITRVRWFPATELPELQPETAGALVALARSSAPSSLDRLPIGDGERS